MSDKIFAGLTVIDCGSFIAAPAAAMMMADLGADVIKVEPPGAGDPNRHMADLPGLPTSEHAYGWQMDGRNKRSITLDLAQEDGQAVLHRLVADADVFVTNYPMRVRTKLGLDHETLSGLNPSLVYGSFTGYGEKGAEAAKPGFDATAYWARSGLMDLLRSSRDTAPTRAAVGQGDHPSAITLYAGLVTALYRRALTGEGAYVSSSLLANGLWGNAFFASASLSHAHFEPRPEREQSRNALSLHYRGSDDKWFILTLLNEDRYWPRLVQVLERPGLADDPRFATRQARHENAPELIALLDEIFAQHERAHWTNAFTEAGIIFDSAAEAEELRDDEQARANDMFVSFDDAPGAGAVAVPFTVQGAEPGPHRRAPELGEHSREVLAGLGYSDEQIGALVERGVTGGPTT